MKSLVKSGGQAVAHVVGLALALRVGAALSGTWIDHDTV